MINKIIKDWVGEERTEKTVHTPNCTRGTCKNNHFFCAISPEDEAVNEYIQDLTSRIPQLTERIFEIMQKQVDDIYEEPERTDDDIFEARVIEDFINTLKGGKE